MTLRYFVLALSFAAFAQDAGAQQRPSRLQYVVQGLMSRPLNIDMDLDTGLASVSEVPAGGVSRVYSTVHLSSEQLGQLRDAMRNALATGMENDDCQKREKVKIQMPPQMDSIISMSFSLPSGEGAAPTDPSCWNTAANRLAATIYSAAHPAKP